MDNFDHSHCQACNIVDKLDGKVDGKLFNLEHWKVPNELKRFNKVRALEDRISDRITSFAGSLNFIYLHVAWFAFWIADNLGLFGKTAVFDGFPFGLLTMAVSLEAIFLSTFVMVSQNRQSKRGDLRSQIDFESNLQSLIWTVHLGAALGVDVEHVEKLCAEAISESRKTTSGTGDEK
jgi:uncharacterized membrane protein